MLPLVQESDKKLNKSLIRELRNNEVFTSNMAHETNQIGTLKYQWKIYEMKGKDFVGAGQAICHPE